MRDIGATLAQAVKCLERVGPRAGAIGAPAVLPRGVREDSPEGRRTLSFGMGAYSVAPSPDEG